MPTCDLQPGLRTKQADTATGGGGRYPRELFDRIWLYSFRRPSNKTANWQEGGPEVADGDSIKAGEDQHD